MTACGEMRGGREATVNGGTLSATRAREEVAGGREKESSRGRVCLRRYRDPRMKLGLVFCTETT